MGQGLFLLCTSRKGRFFHARNKISQIIGKAQKAWYNDTVKNGSWPEEYTQGV